MRTLNKIDKRPGEDIFVVCKKSIIKLTDYFFVVLDLGTESFGNGCLSTQLEENYSLIKYCAPMYIGFYEYPPYRGRISEMFEKNVNKNIQCYHGYAYS